jgi:prepilin-type N-terminal cleavage/methylation domain-containing protein
LPTSRTDETAFTLLEVVVVLAVLALAVGLVLPRFGDVGTLSVDAAASELAATINLTRERAILGARPLRMALDVDAGRWTIDGTERGALPARVHLRRITTGETSNGAGVVALDFDPAGDPLPARFDLADDRGHAASVVVPPAGGRAVVRR